MQMHRSIVSPKPGVAPSRGRGDFVRREPSPPSTVIWHRQARVAWFTAGGTEREKKRKEARNGFDGTIRARPDVSRTKIESVVLRGVVIEAAKQISAVKKKKGKKVKKMAASRRSSPGEREEERGEERGASKRVPHESFTKGWHV